MGKVRLSLIIATYNRGPKLMRTLESLRGQTLPFDSWELVVVNNNSTDNTAGVFETFVRVNPGINARIFTELRQGVSYARNRAIAESKGEYIVSIDDDELASDSLLRDYLDFFDSRPEVAAAGGRILPEYEAAKPQWLSPYTERPIAGTVDFGEKIRPFPKGAFFGGGNMGFRRSITEKYGVFDSSLGRKGVSLMGGEEKDFFFRLIDGGEQIYYLPNAVIHHIIEPERLTKEYFIRLCSFIGVSERVRTLNVSRSAYARRIIIEGVKWCGALAISLWYLLKMQPSKSLYLLIMRVRITRGLLSGTLFKPL